MIDLNKMSISDIIEQLNWENGSNYKIEVLNNHKDNELLKRVLKMAYDKVTYVYGVTMKNITVPTRYDSTLSLSKALDILEEKFVTRIWTGNESIRMLQIMLKNLSENDSKVLEKVINRDLRINMGRSNINKVFKNLITKEP